MTDRKILKGNGGGWIRPCPVCVSANHLLRVNQGISWHLYAVSVAVEGRVRTSLGSQSDRHEHPSAPAQLPVKGSSRLLRAPGLIVAGSVMWSSYYWGGSSPRL